MFLPVSVFRPRNIEVYGSLSEMIGERVDWLTLMSFPEKRFYFPM